MRARRPSIVHAAASVYLDPASCDSTVSYKVVSRSRLYGSIQLADCSRKIDWYFGGTAESLKKIDKAIQALQDFRAVFAVALKKKRTPLRKKVE